MIRYIHYGITGLAPSLARCFQNEIILPFALFFHNSPQLLLLLSYVDRFLLSDSKTIVARPRLDLHVIITVIPDIVGYKSRLIHQMRLLS